MDWLLLITFLLGNLGLVALGGSLAFATYEKRYMDVAQISFAIIFVVYGMYQLAIQY